MSSCSSRGVLVNFGATNIDRCQFRCCCNLSITSRDPIRKGVAKNYRRLILPTFSPARRGRNKNKMCALIPTAKIAQLPCSQSHSLVDGWQGGDEEAAGEAGVLGDVDGGHAVQAQVLGPVGEVHPGGVKGAAGGAPRGEAGDIRT